MSIFITIIHVLVCFVLILVILLQAGRGQGLTGATFGSGNVQSLFGTKASSFLTKATSVSAICFMLTCITLDIIEVQKSKSLLEGTHSAAPVDVDQIKKALEKVKSESQAQAGADAANAAEAVKTAASDAVQAVSDTAASVSEQAASGAAQALDASKQTVTEAAALPEPPKS